MTSVHKHIVFIDDVGVTLATYGNALVIRSRTMPLTALPKHTHTIIVDGFGGSITTAAINAAASKYVEILIAARSHGTFALFAPQPHINASRAALKVRERQFRAAFDPRKTVEVATAIVGRKIKAERHARLDERAFLTGLQAAKTVDDVRHAEAKTAQIWWRQWTESRMRFAGAGVPTEWRSWPGRYRGAQRGYWASWVPNSRREVLSIRCRQCSTMRLVFWRHG
jgi:CRISPR/Cas system-associated endonuclease Cas1